MAGILDSVNQRTRLVGQNRLELLMFRLGGQQLYGINVFKVREVIKCPPLTNMPKRDPKVIGVAHIRGTTIAVLDMRMTIGLSPQKNINDSYVIISEYNKIVQGFLVSAVDRIVNINWEEIHPPPQGAGRGNYLTAVTQVDKNLVEIIDVEKILEEMIGQKSLLNETSIDNKITDQGKNLHILLADDSVVARKQVLRCLAPLNVGVTTANDGKQAWNELNKWVDEKDPRLEQLVVIISDIEMPEMDGYTLTSKVKEHPQLKDVFLLLHTSLSGVFNQSLVDKVGADGFLSKFQPDDLSRIVQEQMKIRYSQ